MKIESVEIVTENSSKDDVAADQKKNEQPNVVEHDAQEFEKKETPAKSQVSTPVQSQGSGKTAWWNKRIVRVQTQQQAYQHNGKVKSMNARNGTGTGFWVMTAPNKYQVLTCFHCVSSASTPHNKAIKIKTDAFPTLLMQAKLDVAIPQYDVALLSVDIPEQVRELIRPLKISNNVGSGTLQVAGYPLAMPTMQIVSAGLNGNFVMGDRVSHVLDGAVNQGHSGAPLVADAETNQARVVGMIQSKVGAAAGPVDNMIFAGTSNILATALMHKRARSKWDYGSKSWVKQTGDDGPTVQPVPGMGIYFHPGCEWEFKAMNHPESSGVIVYKTVSETIPKNLKAITHVYHPSSKTWHQVTSHGMATLPDYTIPVPFYLNPSVARKNVRVKGIMENKKGGFEKQEIMLPVDFVPEHATREFHFPFEKPGGKSFGKGLELVDASLNVVSDKPTLLYHKKMENLTKPFVLINSVPPDLQDSQGIHPLKVADEVVEINGSKVASVDDVKKLVKNNKNNFLKIGISRGGNEFSCHIPASFLNE